jgi:hypothetical protein
VASFTIAPAARAALEEATRRWPRRSKVSDGTIGDPAHRDRPSDHNPDRDGVVLAFDLTHDPGAGCDAHRLVRLAVARRDPRIKYAISQGRIWSAERAGEGWRTYNGSNPHHKHAHVSVRKQFADDTRPWWATTAPKPQEPDLTRDEREALFEVRDLLRALVRPRRQDKTDHDPNAVDLGDILTKLENET